MRTMSPTIRILLAGCALAAFATAFHTAVAGAAAWLGVAMQPMSAELREGLDLHEDGVLVNQVVAGSPADKAGLAKGDLIVKFGGDPVAGAEALADAVAHQAEGDKVAVEVVRKGEHKVFTVTLSARPEGAAAPDSSADGAAPAPGRHKQVRIIVDGQDVRPEDLHHFADPSPGQHREIRIETDGHSVRPEDLRDLVDPRLLERIPVEDLGDGRGVRLLRLADRARLGVRIEPLTPDLAAALGAPAGGGVLVLDVTKDTPAARAGLKAGDVITEVNGQGVKDAGELRKSLRGVDGKAKLTVVRKGTRSAVEADLGPAAAVEREEAAPGGEHGEVTERFKHLRPLEGPEGDALRKDVDELRKQLGELRHQLEELKTSHH